MSDLTLKQLTVGDLIIYKEKRRPHANKVICLEHNTTLGQALKVLAKHHILSAPMTMAVSLEDMEDTDQGADMPLSPTLVGWVDVNDILNALLSYVRGLNNGQIPANMLQLMSALEGGARPFNDRAIITLVGGDDKSLVYETERSALLLETIRDRLLSAPGEKGRVVHRLAVFDVTGEIKHILSHLDIIRLLHSRGMLIGDSANKSLEELGLLPSGPTHVVCVDPHVPTLIALDKMAAVGVSGAAVVSTAGELVANLSTSDLRGIQPEHLGVLALPVAEFLALLHRTTYLGFAQTTSKEASHPFFATRRPSVPNPDADPETAQESDTVRLITCTRGSSLKEVLGLMADNNVHRVYVTDPTAKPQVVAVVTPTDVLRWLVKQYA